MSIGSTKMNYKNTVVIKYFFHQTKTLKKPSRNITKTKSKKVDKCSFLLVCFFDQKKSSFFLCCSKNNVKWKDEHFTFLQLNKRLLGSGLRTAAKHLIFQS